MSGLIERVIATIQRYEMFATGQRIGVAVSGGADSVCLLHVLHESAPRWNLHLGIVHIEHGIRGPASKEDAEFVQHLAAAFAFPFHMRATDVTRIDDNLEQAARNVRHEFYRELIATGQFDRIATGHTGSDQAETVLYRFLRGSGVAGLSGIWPVTQDGLVRPLLEVWRGELEAWLRERNIGWREDASNRDLNYARNRLRHAILPVLRERFNPNLDQVLAHTAVVAQDEEAYWSEILPEPDGPVGGPIVLSARTLAHEPAAMARRRIRCAVQRVKGNLREIDFVHIELVLNMARSQPGHGRAQLPGIDVFRSFDWMRISCAGYDSGFERDFQFEVSIPCSVTLPRTGPNVTFELIEPGSRNHPYDKVEDEVDWQRLLTVSASEARGRSGARSCLLELRNWRPGDQYCPVGQSRQKVKTLFQESRIPLWERRHWPVVTYQGTIIWARRFGAASEFAATANSGVVLRIRESPAGK